MSVGNERGWLSRLPPGHLLLLSLALALLLFEPWYWQTGVDDAYITFRYLDQWLAGNGLVFNPGERVEGYSNLLWLLLLAPLRLAGLDPLLAARLLSTLSLLAMAAASWQMSVRLSGERSAGPISLILLAASVQIAFWWGTGMESLAYATLILLAVRSALFGGSSWRLAVWLGLITLMRPNGIAIGLVLFATLWPETTARRKLPAHLLLFLLFPIAQLLFRLHYYDAWLPNTVTAKVGGVTPTTLWIGTLYLLHYLASSALPLLLLASHALYRRLTDRWLMRTVIALTALIVAESVAVGGDYFPYSRFLLPLTPLLIILATISLVRWQQGSRRSEIATSPRQPDQTGWQRLHKLPYRLNRHTATLLAASTLLAMGHLSPMAEDVASIREANQQRHLIADWVRGETQPDEWIAVNAAGIIPWSSQRPTIDMLGLNDRTIARTPINSDIDAAGSKVGHRRHNGDYVCGRRPAIVLFAGGHLTPPLPSAAAATEYSSQLYYPSDVSFLRSPGCQGHYRTLAIELQPTRYLVVWIASRESVDELPNRPVVDDFNGWNSLGLRHLNADSLPAAISAFRRALHHQPDNPQAMLNLAFASLRNGESQAAVTLFAGLLARNPRHHDARYGLAQALERAGQTARAITIWREYLQLAPESHWKSRARKQLEQLLAAEAAGR
jgi:arabinofuranosyltransferase